MSNSSGEQELQFNVSRLIVEDILIIVEVLTAMLPLETMLERRCGDPYVNDLT